jgi:hypothetical protein
MIDETSTMIGSSTANDTVGEFPFSGNPGRMRAIVTTIIWGERAMSLCPQPGSHVPDETVRVARAAFPKGNPYLTLRDELETIYAESFFEGSVAIFI